MHATTKTATFQPGGLARSYIGGRVYQVLACTPGPRGTATVQLVFLGTVGKPAKRARPFTACAYWYCPVVATTAAPQWLQASHPCTAGAAMLPPVNPGKHWGA